MNNVTEYKQASFNILENSKLLEQSDFDLLSSISDELKESYLKHQVFRTRTEMEISVLNDVAFPTPDGKYWQAMREQTVHFTELVAQSYEYRKLRIEIQILERDFKHEEDDLKKELKKIDIEAKRFALLQMEQIAKHRIREIMEWHNIKTKLIPDMKFGLNDVNDHQLITYAAEFIKQSAMMPANIGQAEKQNLIGKMVTTIRVCSEKGLLQKVKEYIGEGELKFLRLNGVKI